LDPNNVSMLNNLTVAMSTVANTMWARGRLDEANDWNRRSLQPLGKTVQAGSFFIANYAGFLSQTGYIQAMSGDFTGALRTATSGREFLNRSRLGLTQDSGVMHLVDQWPLFVQAFVTYEQGDFAGAIRLAAQSTQRVRDAKLVGAVQESFR